MKTSKMHNLNDLRPYYFLKSITKLFYICPKLIVVITLLKALVMYILTASTNNYNEDK